MTYNNKENRKYPRISPGVKYNVMAQHIDKDAQKYFKGVIEDIGLGGVFIKIDTPFPKGSMVTIQFDTNKEDGKQPVVARGLVRWTRKLMQPHGMGVDLVEFEGLGSDSFEEWFKKHFQLS
jgi:hypothetical protein